MSKMELVPSKGGAFEVTVNGEKLYSKLDTGIFPKTKEIIEKMQQ
ncbi:Rdx family protein [Bacillus sp. CMF12]|nr:Rdx family protein [Cytobacillus oceanisediminis]USK52505.1 Rdx family protein [Bacillus sp. CMF12]